MNRLVPILSRIMLVAGGLMILAGLGWGIWMRVNAPPPPEIGDAGAVVLAVTAPVRRATHTPTLPPPTPTPTSTPSPTTPPPPDPAATGPVTGSAGEVEPTANPTATEPPPTPTPTVSPSPTPSPTPTPEPQPPVRIVAPAIDLDAKVVPMTWELVDSDGTMISEWIVPVDAAGWHVNSAMPGQQENVVLSGHHNIEGKVFRYVIDLEPGDTVTVYAGERAFEYIVTEKYILKEAGMPLRVRQRNAQWIMPTGDERLTLITCWPYEWPGNSHRVIVVARPPSYYWDLMEESDTVDEQTR
ncbi:MAG: sortase [Anaerolineae bacterium]